jgi:hypothetical protein
MEGYVFLCWFFPCSRVGGIFLETPERDVFGHTQTHTHTHTQTHIIQSVLSIVEFALRNGQQEAICVHTHTYTYTHTHIHTHTHTYYTMYRG